MVHVDQRNWKNKLNSCVFSKIAWKGGETVTAVSTRDRKAELNYNSSHSSINPSPHTSRGTIPRQPTGKHLCTGEFTLSSRSGLLQQRTLGGENIDAGRKRIAGKSGGNSSGKGHKSKRNQALLSTGCTM